MQPICLHARFYFFHARFSFFHARFSFFHAHACSLLRPHHNPSSSLQDSVHAAAAAAGVTRRERRPVRLVEGCTAEHFKNEVAQTQEPALLRGLPLGPCVDLWTPEHLVCKGGDKEVSVHVSPHDRMDFITKNFKYHTLAFDELVKRAAYGCKPATHTGIVHMPEKAMYT